MQEFVVGTKRRVKTRDGLNPGAWPLMFVAASLFVAAAIGCRSAEDEIPEATAHVSGTIAIGGKPVGRGTVCFYSLETGATTQGSLDKSGKFAFESPVSSGKYTVYLGGVSRIPEKYLSETSSDYTVTLGAGSNDLTIDLK
ncbi:MAG: hypothetical protein ABFD16_12805 [Thermoguttaceae bacterium]